MVDVSLIDSSRDYRVSRYFNLIRVIDRFYADGVISDAELESMEKMRSETLINYQVAADMLHKMDKTAPEYDKLKELVDYLRKCWVLMDYASDRGILNNHEKNKDSVQKKLNPKKKEKTSLTLGTTEATKALVAGLKTPQLRREANAGKIARDVKKLPREVREKAALEIVKDLEALKQQDLMLARHRLMEIERSRVA